ncbi:MAG: C1 family peptidase [Chloroflexota bacterium]
MNKKINLFVTALLLVMLAASMFGSQTVFASAQAASQVRWEAVVKLSPDAVHQATQDRSVMTDPLLKLGVSARVDGEWFSLKGQKDAAQMSAALFDNTASWIDLLGGPVELTINLPSNGKPIALNLEARNTTGYMWEVVSGGAYQQDGEATFTMRYRGMGAPAIQTIRMAAMGSGDTSIRLVYHRPFEAASEPRARLTVWMTEAADAFELSDPTPKVVEVKEIPAEDPDAYTAELGELKTALPASWDWRTSGIVTPVRDQGTCGSCWAFGTVGVMESAIAKAGGPMTDLSEQFLIDCNKDGWDCGGGLTATKYHYNVLGYNQTAAGAVLESAKPYLMANGTCTVAYAHPYKASSWAFIVPSEFTMPTVDAIKNAIYTYGPITAGVCADNGWNTYSGGVYNPSSNACGGGTNHQIVLVGWDDATETWILRNSWGPGWGDGGYMHIKWDTTGTKSRVGEGTSWVRYTAPAAGFDSDFNGTTTGWSPVNGTWSIFNGLFYKSTGIANMTTSAKHTGSYTNLNYTAKVRRYGPCTGCAVRMIIRGRTVLTSTGAWRPSYLFQYSNDGYFSVFEITSTGSSIALKNWTASTAVKKEAWNTLKVVASNATLKFYINGVKVWQGTDTTLTSGYVGLGYYRDGTAGTLLVDWANLVPLATSVNPAANAFEVTAPGEEVPGGTVDMSP